MHTSVSVGPVAILSRKFQTLRNTSFVPLVAAAVVMTACVDASEHLTLPDAFDSEMASSANLLNAQWPEGLEPSGMTQLVALDGSTLSWPGFNDFSGSNWVVVSDPESKDGNAVEKRFFGPVPNSWTVDGL